MPDDRRPGRLAGSTRSGREGRPNEPTTGAAPSGDGGSGGGGPREVARAAAAGPRRDGEPGPAGRRVARWSPRLTAPAVLVTLLIVRSAGTAPGAATAGLVWGLLATVFVTGIPFAYILRGVRRGRLTDHHVGRREQRRVPLLVGLASAAGGLALLAVLGAPRPVLALVAAGVVGLVVAVSVSHWWKMSIHSAVAAGTLVVLVLDLRARLLVATPLLGLVGWSRVRLGDHTVAQVVVGGALGALVAAAVFGRCAVPPRAGGRRRPTHPDRRQAVSSPRRCRFASIQASNATGSSGSTPSAINWATAAVAGLRRSPVE